MSSSSCSPPKQTTSAVTSSHEEQVISDLQTQLRQLAQQNRDSIAKALSAAEATRSVSSQASQPATAHSTTVVPLPPKTEKTSKLTGLPDSLTTSIHPAATFPELDGISNDLHPLTLSKSSPAQYSSVDPDDPLAVPVWEGHHRVEQQTSDPANTQLKSLTLKELPFTKPANRNLLTRQLEDTKAKVLHLDTKLKECNDLCEQQKLHFRMAIVDLQTKLNDTIVGRNSVLELRRKEAESQERLINQLQRTFTDVEASNRQQDQVLQDAICKVSSLHGELQACNATLTQINTLAVHHATKRGLTLMHKTTYSGPMDLEQVVNTLKEVLDCYEKELERMGQKVGKAEQGLSEAQEQFAEKWKQNGEEQKQMMRKLREEQDKQLTAATERALNARKQTLSLQSQLALTHEQMQQQLDGKTSHITELQRRLEKLQDETETARNILQTKCDTLLSELNAAQRQHTITTEENNQLHDQIQSLQQQLHDAKESITIAEADVETMRQQNHQLTSLEQEFNIKVDNLKAQLESKTSECVELGRLVEEVRQESARQAEERVLTIEENSKHRIETLTDDMTSQISDITHKYNTLSSDIKQRETELDDTLKTKEALARRLEEVQQELQRVTEEKTGMVHCLDERGRELEVMRGEKGHIVALLEERNNELAASQIVKDQLQVQVNEKDVQCQRLQEQSSSMSQLAEVTRRASEDWKQEQSQMKQTLDAQTKELQDLKGLQESLSRKLKIREKRLRNVEEDNKRLQEEAQGTAKESQSAIRSKEETRNELMQAKTQTDLLTIEQEKLKLEILEKEQSHQRDVNKYKSKVQTLQRELHTAHKTIKATSAIDGKAVQVAESMQKQVTAKRSEIDTLQSDIHWLKECLDITRKEKSALAGERDRYKTQVSEMNKNNENLMKEQQLIKDKRSQQSSLVAKLEDSLKKAAMKHGECKAVIERQEQDMVRLKLKHQLDMKELQRATRTGPSTSIPCKSSSQITKSIESTSVTSNKVSNTATVVTAQRLEDAKANHSRDTRPSRRTHTNSTKGVTKGIDHTYDNDSNKRCLTRDLSLSAKHLSPIVSNVAAERDGVLPRGEGTQTSPVQRDALAKLLTDGALRLLLLEMYGIVSGQPNIPNGQIPNKSQHQPTTVHTASTTPTTTHVTSQHIPTRFQEDGKSKTVESGYSAKSMERQTKTGMMTAPLLTSSPVRNHQSSKPENLSFLSSVPGTGDSLQTIPEPDFLSRPRSPVTSLLGVSPRNAKEDNKSQNNNSQAGPLRLSSFENTERSKVPDSSREEYSMCASSLGTSQGDGGMDQMVQSEQLRLLQDKLHRLSEMGGHLQRENKDMAIMIKQQGTRIRKCRQQEQQAQQLVKKGR